MHEELLAKLRQKNEVYTEHGERGRPLGKHRGMLSEYERMQQRRLRCIKNLICQGKSRTKRRASSSASEAKGRLEKM